MSRIARSLMLIYFVFHGSYVVANDYLVDIDMRDAMYSWQEDVEALGDLDTLTKSIIKGDIYETAYARAELNIAKPSTMALDATYDHIQARCEGNLMMQDVTTVFAETPQGRELFGYMKTRDMVADVAESEQYGVSCSRVVACYGNMADEQRQALGYTTQVRNLCATIVSGIYDRMHVWAQRLQTLPDINYGDDLLANAKPDDGPFDLLKDIETIGAILFSHNDPASEIHFFRVEEPDEYVDNDPHLTTPYIVQQPNWDENDNRRRFEPTSGLDPQFPKSVYDDTRDPQPDAPYIAPQLPSKDTSLYTDDTPIGGSPAAVQAIANSIGSPSESAIAGTLQNSVLCLDPVFEEDEEDTTLELAEIQQEQTYTYNKKLDLETSVSLALAAILSPDIEEQYGIDPVLILTESRVDPSSVASAFGATNLQGDTLEDIEAGMKSCVEQFTDLADTDPNTVRKAVRKNISQPTAFTSCIMSHLCFEITDDTGRGLYRIQGCTIPSRRGYSVADNQPVMSIEEILDEMVNVCVGLEESGQLLEHNKTKDARDHKLMRVKFGDKFSFSLSVGFKPLKNNTDPAHEKRMQIENNRYLADNLLGINNNLTHIQQRNKYIQFADPFAPEELRGIDTPTQQDLKNDLYEASLAAGDEIRTKEQWSQLEIYSRTLDTIDAFVDLNTYHWIALNDITHSIAQQWQQEAAQAKQGK